MAAWSCGPVRRRQVERSAIDLPAGVRRDQGWTGSHTLLSLSHLNILDYDRVRVGDRLETEGVSVAWLAHTGRGSWGYRAGSRSGPTGWSGRFGRRTSY